MTCTEHVVTNSVCNVSWRVVFWCHVSAQEEEEEEDNRLSAEAERQFNQQHHEEGEGEEEEEGPLTHRPATEQPAAAFVNISFELEPEPPLAAPDTSRVAAPLSSWWDGLPAVSQVPSFPKWIIIMNHSPMTITISMILCSFFDYILYVCMCVCLCLCVSVCVCMCIYMYIYGWYAKGWKSYWTFYCWCCMRAAWVLKEERGVTLPRLESGWSIPAFGWKCPLNINMHLILKELNYVLTNIWPTVTICLPLCVILQIFIVDKRTHLLFLRKHCSGLFCRNPQLLSSLVFSNVHSIVFYEKYFLIRFDLGLM